MENNLDTNNTENELNEEKTELENALTTDDSGMKRKLILAILATLALIAILFFCLFRTPRFESITLELGTDISGEAKYYMYGSPVALKNAQVDVTAVDNMVVGEYTANVNFKKKTIAFSIVIEDTTPPELVLNNTDNINIGIEHGVDSFIKETSDLAGPVETWVTVNNETLNPLVFDEIKDYNIGVFAKDINGNQSVEIFTIHTVDTIAPEITEFEEYGYYGVGDEYGIHDFVQVINDNSGLSFVSLKVNEDAVFENVECCDTDIFDSAPRDSESDDSKTYISEAGNSERAVGEEHQILFPAPGEYKVEITATDETGNSNTSTLTINADFRPELYGVSEKTVKAGTEYDLTEGILAWDNEEGFISERVSVEGQVDMETPGEYEIVYMVEDQHGLVVQECTVITVDESVFNTNTATYPEDIFEKLLEADYFSYELLEEKDQEKAAELMYPCQIALEDSTGRGSGFIYKIDEDYIYIGTMGHCVSRNAAGTTLNIWFYNPTYDSQMSHKSTKRCLQNLKVTACERVYSNAVDKAMFTISIDQIPTEVLVTLKEVNKTNEKNISTDNGIYTDTIYVAKDMYTGQFKKSFTVFNKTGPDYEYMLDYFSEFKNNAIWLLTNERGVPGQSGSLLYDGYGNPVASLAGGISYNGYSIGRHVYFSEFAELYEKLNPEASESADEGVADAA